MSEKFVKEVKIGNLNTQCCGRQLSSSAVDMGLVFLQLLIASMTSEVFSLTCHLN